MTVLQNVQHYARLRASEFEFMWEALDAHPSTYNEMRNALQRSIAAIPELERTYTELLTAEETHIPQGLIQHYCEETLDELHCAYIQQDIYERLVAIENLIGITHKENN